MERKNIEEMITHLDAALHALSSAAAPPKGSKEMSKRLAIKARIEGLKVILTACDDGLMIEARLAAAGFESRRPAKDSPIASGRREVFRLADGARIGLFTASESLALIHEGDPIKPGDIARMPAEKGGKFGYFLVDVTERVNGVISGNIRQVAAYGGDSGEEMCGIVDQCARVHSDEIDLWVLGRRRGNVVQFPH
jgi:hypothetical protein